MAACILRDTVIAAEILIRCRNQADMWQITVDMWRVMRLVDMSAIILQGMEEESLAMDMAAIILREIQEEFLAEEAEVGAEGTVEAAVEEVEAID